MIEFKSGRPIYRQIIDYCFVQILSEEWKPEERVPSVRELSVQMTVNTHTVLKAFDYLQQHDIITPRRGMGFYLTADARSRVEAARREEFFDTTLPMLFEEMKRLGISMEDVVQRFQEF